MSDKRIAASVCPACEGTTLAGSAPHGPEDDLRAIRERDAAYDSMSVFKGPLSDQPTGRLQMAADRRMLLRMLDAELAAPSTPDGGLACTCGRIMLNSASDRDSGARNWNPDCPAHGTDTEWYRTEGKAHHDEVRQRSIDLQRRAREARLAAAHPQEPPETRESSDDPNGSWGEPTAGDDRNG